MRQQLRTAGRLSVSTAVLMLGIAVVVPDASAQSGRSRTSERTERSSTGRTSSASSASKASTKSSDSKQRGAAKKQTATTQKKTAPAARGNSAGRTSTASGGRAATAKRDPLKPATGRSDAGKRGTSAARTSDVRGGNAAKAQTSGRNSGATRSGGSASRGATRSGGSASSSATRSGGSASRTVTRATNGGRVTSGADERNVRDRADARKRTTAADRTRTGSRPIRDRVRYAPNVLPTYRNHYGRAHRAEYAWCNIHHHPGHYHYASSRIHISSHLYIGVRWPWLIRFQHNWRPRYRYRQVVYVESGWGGNRYSQQVDVRTTYRQRVIRANDQFAEIEIEIDGIEIYQGGQYLGLIDRIPSRLSRIRAKVYEDGFIEFDRNVHLVGDRYRGFEILSTEYYDDYLLNAYRSDHNVRVGRVDLRRGRVRNVSRSRLFGAGSFSGLVPISLLPDDDRLWDYGRDVISDNYGYGDGSYGDDWRFELNRSDEIRYNTEAGVAVDYNRETQLERIN